MFLSNRHRCPDRARIDYPSAREAIAGLSIAPAEVWSRVRETSYPSMPITIAPLAVGAVLFGVGWGLVGICPGPALVNLAGLSLGRLLGAVEFLPAVIARSAGRCEQQNPTDST